MALRHVLQRIHRLVSHRTACGRLEDIHDLAHDRQDGFVTPPGNGALAHVALGNALAGRVDLLQCGVDSASGCALDGFAQILLDALNLGRRHAPSGHDRCGHALPVLLLRFVAALHRLDDRFEPLSNLGTQAIVQRLFCADVLAALDATLHATDVLGQEWRRVALKSRLAGEVMIERMPPLVRQRARAGRAGDVDLVHAGDEVRKMLAAALCAHCNAQHAVQAHRLGRHIQDLGEVKEGVVQVVEVQLALAHLGRRVALHPVAEVDAAEPEGLHDPLGRDIFARHAPLCADALGHFDRDAFFADLVACLLALGLLARSLLRRLDRLVRAHEIAALVQQQLLSGKARGQRIGRSLDTRVVPAFRALDGLNENPVVADLRDDRDERGLATATAFVVADRQAGAIGDLVALFLPRLQF